MNRRQALAAIAGLTALPARAVDLWSVPPRKIDTAKRQQSALRLPVLVDRSESSPVFDGNFLRQAWRVIEREITALQSGDELIVSLVGDPTRHDAGMWRARVQQRADNNGGPVETLTRRARGHLAGLTRERHGMQESALVAALHDGAALLNPHARQAQTLIFITDGIEWSRTSKGSERSCRDGFGCVLPAPRFRVPPGSRALMLGIGLGAAADQQQEIKTAWANLLRQGGFSTMQLLTRF